MLRRGALLFLKVIRQISRSLGSKNRRFWPKLGVSRLKNRRFESNLSKITRPVPAIKSLRFALFRPKCRCEITLPSNLLNIFSVIFSCDQAALWMVFSFRLSVCLSVTPFWLCSHHRIIMKFSGVITNDRSDVHAKGQGQRSKVKVTEVMTPFNRFRTVTPVWIHKWLRNDAQSLK